MADNRLRILIVDDEKSLRVPLQNALQRQFGHLVDVAENGAEAVAMVEAADGRYDVVVLDQTLIPGPLGIDVMKQLRSRWPNLECIIMTGWGELRDASLAAGAFAYLDKPFDVRELALWLRNAAQTVRARLVQDAILSGQPAAAVLSLIVENVRTLLQADQAAIVLQDTVTGRLEVHDLPKFDRWTRHFTKRLLTREIAESRQPVILPDLNTVPGLDPRFAAAGYRSLIGMPILRGNRAEGALYVYSKRESHFDDWARAVTGAFARFAGLAVANLYMARQIESYGVYTEELLALDGKMVRAADEAEQLELTWRFVHDTLGIDTFFVAFYDQATDTLWFPAAYDEGAPVSIPPRKLAGDREQWGITGHAVRTGEELSWQSESDKSAQCAALGIKPVEFGPKCRSCFCMPICSDEGIIGTLSIQAYRDHAFSPAQIEACRALGRQLVPAIINARLIARQRKTTEQLAALGNLARHISAEQNQGSLLRTVIHAALPLLDAEGGAIYVLQPSGGAFKQAAVLPEDFGVPYSSRDVGIRGLVLQTGTAQAVPDYYRWERRIPELDEQRLTAVAAAPIRLGDHILGVLIVHRKRENYPFTGDDLAVLDQAAGHAALALQKAQLAQQSQAIQQLSMSIAETADLGTVLNGVCQAGVDLFGADHSGLLLFDDDRQAGFVAGEYPAQVGALGITVPLKEVSAEEALVDHDVPIVIAQLEEERATLGPVYEILHGLGIQSVAIVPIVYQGKKLGSLSLDAIQRARRFSAEEVELMKAFASQAAVAISNAQLYNESSQRGRLLEALDRASFNVRAVQDETTIFYQVVRSGAELLGCDVGCLLRHRPYLGQLEVVAVLHLPEALVGQRVAVADAGFAGEVARSGQRQVTSSCDGIFQLAGVTGFPVCAGVPLSAPGSVEAVLLLGKCDSASVPTKGELEILDRFAAQMSHVLRSAKLLTPDQRIQSQLNILHQIGDYIQQARDMDSILHVVLTGVTAGYGLGLNRAALFLLDDKGESLVGRMGIGNLDEQESHRDWRDHHRDHREDLRAYIRLLEAGALVETPVGRSIRSLSVPLTASGLLGQVLEEGKPVRLESADLALLPQTLVASLALSAPAVIVPLRMGQRPVGVLVADNKFTKVPIGDELLEALVTFVSTATVVIRNYDLWDMTRRDKERLQRFLKASTALVASEAPKQSVEKTIEAAMQASGAAGVSLILLNSDAEMLDVVAVGIDREHPDLLVRKDGLSMQVLRDGHFEKIENADAEREKRSINSYMLSRDVKAALCLPVQAEGERLGVMWFHFAEPHVFTETEIGDFQFFVNQAALAHDSARRLETLEEMRRAATALTQATETRAVLAAIVAHACSVMRARAAWVWPYDDEASCFRPEGFAISDGVDGASAEWIRKSPPRPGGTTELVMKDGFIPVESIADRERYPFLDDDHRSNLRAAGVASFLGERLAVGEKKLGVIYFAFGAARKFSEWEREMARALTYQAALALNNAELMAEVREAMESAAAVAEITTLGELPQVMDSIAEQFARALHCDTVTLYAYDAERDQFLFPPATLGLRDRGGVLALRYVEMGSAVGRVMALDEARFSTDARNDPLLNQGKFLVREGVRSTVAVPLQDREGKAGALFLGYRNLHQFTPHEAATVDLLVNQAAIGIRNAQLYQRTQDDARVRKAIQEASRKISRARSLDETLEQVAHEALALSGNAYVEGCFAHVALKSGSWLRFMSASQPDILARWRSELGDIDLNRDRIGLTGQVALTGAPASVGDIAPHRAGGGNYLELDHRTRSELCVPLAHGSRVLGVINLEHPLPHAFDDRVFRALQILADQAAVAVENASLLERQRVIGQIGQDTARRLEIVPFVEGLFASLAPVFAARRMPVYPSLTTYLPDRGQLLTYLTRFYTDNPRTETRDLDGARGIIPWVARNRRPYYARDVGQDPNYWSYRSGTCSEIAVPVVFGDALLGVLDIESPAIDPFEEEDIVFLSQVADQVAAHLNAIRQYDELNEQKRQMAARAAVTWIGMVGSVFRHSVDKHAATIRDAVPLVQHALDANDREAADNWLKMIGQLATTILEKPLSTPLSSEEEARPIPVNAFLRERVARLWDSEPYRLVPVTLRLQLGDGASVRASDEWLRRALEIILHNAVKMVAGCPDPQITVRSRRAGERAEILVTDTGPGIPAPVQDILFKEPIKKAEGEPGLGIGLLLARMIVEVYKGTIHIGQPGPGGTTIVISLPLT